MLEDPSHHINSSRLDKFPRVPTTQRVGFPSHQTPPASETRRGRGEQPVKPDMAGVSGHSTLTSPALPTPPAAGWHTPGSGELDHGKPLLYQPDFKHGWLGLRVFLERHEKSVGVATETTWWEAQRAAWPHTADSISLSDQC